MVNVNRRYVADFDWTLFSLALGLAVFGVLEISSVQPSPGLWRRQLVGVGIGLLLMFLITLHDYRRILNAAPYLYAIGVALLLLVQTPLGKTVNNNRSWLELGSFSFQPSEMAKIFTLMFLAYYLAGVRKRPLDLRTVVVAVGIWALPTALVFMENDTGSALSFTSFLAAMLFLAGVRWSWMVAALVAVVIAVIVVAPRIKNCETYKCERVKSVYWPGGDRRRLRSDCRKRPARQHTGRARFFTRGSQRFYFRRSQRGVGIHRQFPFIGHLPDDHCAADSDRAPFARTNRDAAGRGFSGSAALSRDGQRGDGHSTLADYGNPAASDELRIDVGRGHMFRPRTGDQRAPATLCELSLLGARKTGFP
jgi:hypothetical protein